MDSDFTKLQKEVEAIKQRLSKFSSLSKDGRFSDRVVFDKKVVFSEKSGVPTVFAIGEVVNVNGKILHARDASYLISAGVGVRDVAAGTATDIPTLADTLIRCSTSAGQALTITLPEAANSLGLMLVFTFVVDGGQNITINRTGSDTVDDNGDTGNTAITLQDAGDTIAIMAVQDNIWAVLNNIGCTLT